MEQLLGELLKKLDKAYPNSMNSRDLNSKGITDKAIIDAYQGGLISSWQKIEIQDPISGKLSGNGYDFKITPKGFDFINQINIKNSLAKIPHLRKPTKTEVGIGVLYSILLLIVGAILTPIFQPIGLLICQAVSLCVTPKPFIAVILTPANLITQNHTVVIENPKNLTVDSFAFYINAVNLSANLKTNITAHTVGGNINITYPEGNKSTRNIYVIAHNIRAGDSGVINITLSKPSKINITVTRTEAQYCTEIMYWYAMAHLNQYVSSPIIEMGNCSPQYLNGFKYSIKGELIVNYSIT